MSDDGSQTTIHEGRSRRRGEFTSEYTAARGDQAGTASIEIPDTLEGPNPTFGSRVYKYPNPEYEDFPPEEGGQGVLFHRTRPKISGWYGTGNAMLKGEALAGAVQQSIKHTGMFPRRDTVLSKDSGAAVANFIGKPEIKNDSTYLEGTDLKEHGATIARNNASFANVFLGNSTEPVDTYRGAGALRHATDEEKAEAKGALRELPKYKAIYRAMEEGRQWDPNSISAFRDRNAKKVVQSKPKKVKPDPNQLELDL